MPQPPMTDDEFRQLVQRTLGAAYARQAEHAERMAAHEARMTQMERQYEKLLDVQLDLARSHDEHEGRMDALMRLQRGLQRSHEDHAMQMAALHRLQDRLHRTQEVQAQTLEQMRLTLDAIKEILRERRN